eukprot:TRINITY_DN18456_c0_g1_i1.p2 TRINITY_DN18456_c0_g1~~TRINITY_DN18456_c0_g1_i1.p2  ORF type:complete len:155 (-),score=56.36 TRINITY_DN18456_c0_g1_i1:51-485(-)
MAFLFEDIFVIKEKDRDGKKFDKVSRIICTGENYEMELHLDVNIDIYPLEEGQKFNFALARTLNLDGSPMEDFYDQTEKPSYADKYEYVMYGKVFKWIEEKAPSQKVSVLVSFGGLLMMLTGDPRNLQQLELDSHIYLLMRLVG